MSVFLNPKLKKPKNILENSVIYETFITNIENSIFAFCEKLLFTLMKKHDHKHVKKNNIYSSINTDCGGP